MKARSNRSCNISASRWLAYAAASAATALTSASSVDAEIHYSGRVDVKFKPDENKIMSFPLEDTGAFLRFGHYTFVRPYGFVEIEGLRSGAFAGYSLIEYAVASRLRRSARRYISEEDFVQFYDRGTLYNEGGRGHYQWGGKVRGFVGFRFDNGAGTQYGWARVRTLGEDAGFALLDYAFADPGEPIRPGQTSASAQKDVTEEGSLGLLAIGATGLALWRRRRRGTSV